MDNNLVKLGIKLADTINKDDKKLNKVNKASKGGTVNDESTTVNAGKIINNHYSVTLTDKQLDEKLGLAHTEILQGFKDELKS